MQKRLQLPTPHPLSYSTPLHFSPSSRTARTDKIIRPCLNPWLRVARYNRETTNVVHMA